MLLITMFEKTDGLAESKQLSESLGLKGDFLTFSDLMKKKIPERPLDRIILVGHGSDIAFGGERISLTAEQLADQLASFLKENKRVKEIDFIACNVGLIDKSGDCYAAKVKSHLLAKGYDVNVNAFVTDNKDESIVKSFFVIGRYFPIDENEREELGDKTTLLRDDEFSLNLLEVSDQKQREVYEKLNKIVLDKIHLSNRSKLIDVLRTIREEVIISEESFEKKFKDHLKENYQMTDEEIKELFKKNKISFNDKESSVSCDFLRSGSVVELRFPRDFARAKEEFKAQKREFDEQINELKLHLTTNTRQVRDKLKNIKEHLQPVGHSPSAKLEQKATRVATYFFDTETRSRERQEGWAKVQKNPSAKPRK